MADDAPVVGAGLVRIQDPGGAGRAGGAEGALVGHLACRVAPEDLGHRLVGPEEPADDVRGAGKRLREDGPRARPQEPRAEVVHALPRRGQRGVCPSGLGAAGRVAGVVQDHDRVGGQLDVAPDVGLTVVGGPGVPAAGIGVKAEAVHLGGRQGGVVGVRNSLPCPRETSRSAPAPPTSRGVQVALGV